MEFSGFKVYPVGNAKLEIRDDELYVSNISESGLDGVLIDTKGLLDCTINFGDLSSIPENNGVLKTSTLSRNKLNQVATTFESFKYCDRNRENVILGYNKDYLPKEFSVYGTLDGEEVYNFDSSEIIPVRNEAKVDPGTVALIIGIVNIGISIWQALRTKKKTITEFKFDGDGNLTGTTVRIEEDPVPFEVVVNNKKYKVDNVGIHFDKEVPANLIGDPSTEFSPIAEQITGSNLSEFVISSISTPKK